MTYDFDLLELAELAWVPFPGRFCASPALSYFAGEFLDLARAKTLLGKQVVYVVHDAATYVESTSFRTQIFLPVLAHETTKFARNHEGFPRTYNQLRRRLISLLHGRQPGLLPHPSNITLLDALDQLMKSEPYGAGDDLFLNVFHALFLEGNINCVANEDRETMRKRRAAVAQE